MIDDLWYKNAILYSLDVRSFVDANGDGVGDFEGLSRSLGYLSGMGVTALWLLPFHPSPRRDDGYDISNYYDVDPALGTLGDFVDFTQEAKKYGIRVLMDLVVNHTSDRHPWFRSASKGPGSPHHDWYVWSKRKPKDADQGMVFPGSQKRTWSYHPKAKAYYFHRFYDFQPDLNLMNPQVRVELQRIAGFWLKLGVSGFRVDAVPFLIQREGAEGPHPEHFEILQELRQFLQWRTGDAILLAEANVKPAQEIKYFGDEADRMHMLFNFPVNQALFYGLASGDPKPLTRALEQTRLTPEMSQWGHFLRNHDELDLGRLTQAQRQRVFDAFGPEPTMQLYDRGIRRRLAPMLSGDRRRLELAYSLLFTLPGTPVLRYGDEIGMGDDLSLPDRDAVRTAMQWSEDPHGGFTSARRSKVPVISDGPFSFRHINVAQQRRDPDSLMNWTERVIRARKECPEIGWGDWRLVKTDTAGVIALRYDWRGNAALFLHNLDGQPRTVRFTTGPDRVRLLSNLLGNSHSRADPRGKHRIDLEAYGYRWFRLGGLTHLSNRER